MISGEKSYEKNSNIDVEYLFYICSLSGCSGVKNNSSTVIESSRTETEAPVTTTTTVTEEEITDTETESEPTEEEKAVIIQTSQELSQLDTVFYSGHCTGNPAFEMMKEIMGDKLIALHSGETVI